MKLHLNLFSLFLIIIHAQGVTIKLTDADVKYIYSKTANESIRSALSIHPTEIRNNDVADNILMIMKMKHSEK